MPQKKHKPEEIVAKLRHVDVLLSQGRSVGEAVRSIGVTQFTYYLYGRPSRCKHLSGAHPINRGAQMGNPLAPAPTAGRPLRASIIVRLLARRSDLCVSFLRRLANSRAGLQKVARYGSPVRSTAQIIRAFLLATATVARLKPRRSRSWLTH